MSPLGFGARTAALAICAASASAQTIGSGVSIFIEDAYGASGVKVFDEAGQVAPHYPALLEGIELVDIDFTGRTQVEEFLPDRPRRIADVPGASRLALPQQQGSLYRYSREAPDGSRAYGFMLVAANGVARAVWEHAGAGSGGDIDPFLSHVAVASSGNAVLVATTLAAGGDLFELDLDTNAAIARTASLAPFDFDAAGLALGDGWGAAVAADGILRFERATSAEASFVPFANAPAPTWFARQLVLSRNGHFAATIAGTDVDHAHVFVFDVASAAVRASDTPMRIAGAGFLPHEIDGPRLAVSDDGALCAWTGLEPLTSEAYLARLPGAAPSQVTHVTANAIFDPYLDEIGWFSFGPGGALLMGVGDRVDPLLGGLTAVDLFRSTVDPVSGALHVLNLSQSYGQMHPPFVTYSAHVPARIALSPSGLAYFLFSPTVAGGTVLAIRTSAHGLPPLTLMTGVEALTFLTLAGGDLLFGVAGDQPGAPASVYRVPTDFGSAPQMLVPTPDEDGVASAATDGGGRAGFVVPTSDDIGRLWRVDAGGLPEQLTERELEYGPTMFFTSSGALAFSIGHDGAPQLFALWPTSGPARRLQAQKMRGFVLPN